MNWAAILVCGLLGLGIAMLAIPCVLRWASAIFPNRAPDIHHGLSKPVPRLGGVALALAFVGAELFTWFFFHHERQSLPVRMTVVLSSLAIFGLGMWDDIRPLGAKKKLLGQILISALAWQGGVAIETFKVPFTDHILTLGPMGPVVTVLWLVGITNLINLIDGVDGLAGGICLMLLSLLTYVAYQSGTFVFMMAAMTGAVLGFLYYNFPPARIYMGDGGAYFLGFLIGAVSLVSSHKGSVVGALIAPLFVLALPIVDTALAILRRGFQGLPVFRPDRRHLHHRLLKNGMSRRQVVLSFYAVTLLFLAIGFAAFWSQGQWFPVLAGLSLLILLVCAGKLSFSREWFSVGRTLGNSLAMRQEVQYALSFTSWLRHEGERCASIEELYECLLFATKRLGFCSLRLTLADGERTWKSSTGLPRGLVVRHELGGGRFGTFEVSGVVCGQTGDGEPLHYGDRARSCRRPGPSCPCVGDTRLFEITSELLAEAWAKAAADWCPPGERLAFSTPAPRPEPAGAIGWVSRRGTRPLVRRRVRPEGPVVG